MFGLASCFYAIHCSLATNSQGFCQVPFWQSSIQYGFTFEVLMLKDPTNTFPENPLWDGVRYDEIHASPLSSNIFKLLIDLIVTAVTIKLYIYIRIYIYIIILYYINTNIWSVDLRTWMLEWQQQAMQIETPQLTQHSTATTWTNSSWQIQIRKISTFEETICNLETEQNIHPIMEILLIGIVYPCLP